ncbi:MAG: efflux RND transporter periplasmic adaptor subunit [Nibricoccus sp.]
MKLSFWMRSVGLVSCCLLGAAVFFAGCSRNATGPRTPQPVPVQVAKATRQAMPITQKAIGTVQALRSVAVKSQVDGIIQSVAFTEGDEVKAGDLLVSLDKRPFENSLQIAQADLVNARAQANRAATDAERYHQLDQASVVSKEQYAQLVTQAESTKAQVAAKEAFVANAQLQLGYAEIRAPIADRTGQRLLHEGALVKANDAASSIVTINQLAPISVSFAVPERLVDAVRAAFATNNMSVRVTGREDSSLQADGVVDFVDNTVDPTTGMITLKARFENTDHALWPGRFVNVELNLGIEANQIVVPTSAIQVGQKGRQAYILKPDNTVELRDVTIARAAGELTSIAKGIDEGDTIVTDGQIRLVPGAKVVVRTLEEAAALSVKKQTKK